MINSPKKSSNLFKVDDSLKTFLNKPKKAADIVDSITNGNKDHQDEEEEIIGVRKSRSKNLNVKYFSEDEDDQGKCKKNNVKKDDLYDNENSNSGDEDPCVVSKDEYNRNKKSNDKIVENKKSKTFNSPSKTKNVNSNDNNITKLPTNGRYEDINSLVKGKLVYI
jgi:hypothetical protein